ncbi:hypothetical protein D915_002829 [Fasciola hepatica]|uniref:G-protein coupled receptors family 1 profile domain-containing protein n=1 Tax=Fasciola hepatica TaxID=6192 RepID=A0A4E0RV63_FASHE|nr:hypothetical protein D915_002829 [Fasciola hepatica]
MPPHDFWDLTVSYACVTAVGLVITCGLIIVLFNFKLSSKLTLILLRIQSVADAASCLFSILTCTTKSHPTGNQVTDWISCRFWDSQLFYWISVVLSTSNLIWVTIDRVWATLYAVTYKRNFPRYLILSNGVSCLYTAFLVIPVSLLVDHRNGSCQAMSAVTTSDAYYSQNVHPYLWLVTYYFLPSFTMFCVHMRVLHFMRRMNRRNAAANALELEKKNRLLCPFTICPVGLATGLIGGTWIRHLLLCD